VERFLDVFRETLAATGYTRRHPANSSDAQLRRLVLRMGLSAADVPVWIGILRQVLWKIHHDDKGSPGV
jgi:tRNA/rRNA methyltransferase